MSVINIEVLTSDAGEEYEALLHACPHALLYASIKYRDFLASILDGCEARYLVVREAGRIVGALPMFIKRQKELGNVLNSLPFFGSHGGVIVHPQSSNSQAIIRKLLDTYRDVQHELQTITATLVSNPLEDMEAFYENGTHYTCKDVRTGQFTPLFDEHGSRQKNAELLMASFHQKTRNAIRKAQKGGLEVSWVNTTQSREDLIRLHTENMVAIGGTAKSSAIFAAIARTFDYDSDYRIYTASFQSGTIAALLVFFYNRTAEYFTPATDANYRDHQPMSLLIFEAMQEAIRRGCQFWNWGGTWPTQDGVYHFKKRWGTIDRPYYYYVSISDERILKVNRDKILNEFPYFYVVPFNQLQEQSKRETAEPKFSPVSLE